MSERLPGWRYVPPVEMVKNVPSRMSAASGASRRATDSRAAGFASTFAAVGSDTVNGGYGRGRYATQSISTRISTGGCAWTVVLAGGSVGKKSR